MATFYQWQASRDCESIIPRAVLIRRIMNLMDADIDIVEVPIPNQSEEFHKVLVNRLAALPRLEIDDKKFRSSRQIWDYLLSKIKSEGLKSRLMLSDPATGVIIRQWCNDSFINTLIYARWKRDENFARFAEGIQSKKKVEPKSLDALRQRVLAYLDRTSMGDVEESKFREILREQLGALVTQLGDKDYFQANAKAPTLTDLYVFMIVQGLMSPDLAEECEVLQRKFPTLVRWYKDMDTLTQKDAPGSFNTQLFNVNELKR